MLVLASIMLALFIGNLSRFIFGIRDSLASIDITARGQEVTSAVLPLIFLSVVAAFGTMCLAFLFYVRHPSLIQRQRKIQPLIEKDNEIQEHLNRMAFRAGVVPPKVEMPLQGLKGADAQAFGVGSEHKIALDGGFRILRKTKPEQFNALLHHELAHFVNNDVGRSYFSDALWRSIRWLLVLPFLLVMMWNVTMRFILGILNHDLFEFFSASIPIAFGLFVQWCFVLYIAGMIWARLLRTREIYADWRAALWGSQNGLNKILQEETEKEKPKTRFRLWKLHPDAKERIDALERPEILFRLSSKFVFLAGLLLSFIFAGLYFSFAVFLAVGGIAQSLRDASVGLLYWLARGAWWLGFASLIILVFGSIAWLINGVLLPQIQKQAVLDLVNKRGGLIPYMQIGITALIFVCGIEFGFLVTPFGPFARKDMFDFLGEIFIIGPVLFIMAWWYLLYIRFIAVRLSATQIGKNFSVWKSRFIKTASVLWTFLFFVPGIILSRFVDGSLPEIFLYLNLAWLAFTLLLSPLAFGASWAIIKLFFENQPKKCSHCGKITAHAAPAIEFCEHCGGILGEWLFISEKDLTI